MEGARHTGTVVSLRTEVCREGTPSGHRAAAAGAHGRFGQERGVLGPGQKRAGTPCCDLELERQATAWQDLGELRTGQSKGPQVAGGCEGLRNSAALSLSGTQLHPCRHHIFIKHPPCQACAAS